MSEAKRVVHHTDTVFEALQRGQDGDKEYITFVIFMQPGVIKVSVHNAGSDPKRASFLLDKKTATELAMWLTDAAKDL